MRHRIKKGKIGSYNPNDLKVEAKKYESEEISEDIEEIIEEDTELRGDDATLEAIGFYIVNDEND